MDERLKWQRITGGLRADIAQGRYPVGGEVPSEQELMNAYGTSRGPVREALQHLENSGLITPGRPGVRRRVARAELLTVHIARTQDWVSPGESPTMGADAWLGDMRAAGKAARQDLTMITQRAGADLADRLEVGAGSAVVARRLVRHAGGRPHNEVTFWYPASATTGTPLASPESIEEGALAWLEAKHGELDHEVDITIRPAGEDERDRLQIPRAAWVLVVWRTSRNRQGIPLVTSMAVYPGDRTRLVIDHL